MPWYRGPALLQHLENVPVGERRTHKDFRFPVQYVNRPNLYFRGYAGQIASGTVRKGDPVLILPSGKTSRVASITTFDGDLDWAAAPMPVTLTLEDERDISRGDMLVHPEAKPQVARTIDAHLVWMAEEPLAPGRSLLLKQTTQQVTVRVPLIHGKLDVQTMERKPAAGLALNDIGHVRIEASRALLFDPYRENRATGSYILIDPITNATVGAGMILEAVERRQPQGHVTTAERTQRNGHRPALLAVTNQDIALRLERRLFDHGCQVFATDRPVGPTALAWQAGLIVIAPSIEDGRVLNLDTVPLPHGDEASIDALMAYLEQQGVLGVTERFDSGEGI
jgi:sulfate adenylyltransferase subunit 1 (EFTu-like GTPase family)